MIILSRSIATSIPPVTLITCDSQAAIIRSVNYPLYASAFKEEKNMVLLNQINHESSNLRKEDPNPIQPLRKESYLLTHHIIQSHVIALTYLGMLQDSNQIW